MEIRHQELIAAIRTGNVGLVKELVRSSSGVAALLAAQTDLGETALYVAAEKNHVELMEFIAGHCDFQIAATRSRFDLDAFHVAAKLGYVEIVKSFLSLWPGLCKLCDSSNTSPLYSAAVKDHLDVVSAILEVDESTTRLVRKNGKTALHMAARNGLNRIVKVLLDKDPGIVSVIDKKGQTALHMAVKGQNPDVVKEMLLTDLNILNLRDKRGNTALHIATRKWRPLIVSLLLSFESVEVNAINNQNETALDLAEKIPYGESQMDIMENLTEAGAKKSRNVNQHNEASELQRTVSDIRHDVHDQVIQNTKTNKRVSGIKKELRKLQREAVQNTINSVTVVAVLVASIAFVAIFNLPGQYIQTGHQTGEAYIARKMGFQVFYILNSIALFVSLAVVVVQITLVAWETGAQKCVVAVINKLMWFACLSTCGSFLSLSFVVVGKEASWMATTATVVGGPLMVGTLLIMIFLVVKQRFKLGEDSHRRIKRAGTSGSKSFSWSRSAFSDPDECSDIEKIYAL